MRLTERTPCGNPTRCGERIELRGARLVRARLHSIDSQLLHGPGALGLGAVTRIDADVLRGEIAGPVARNGPPCVQVHDQMDVRGEQAIAGGALVEIERLAAAQYVDAGHGDIHARGIEL